MLSFCTIVYLIRIIKILQIAHQHRLSYLLIINIFYLYKCIFNFFFSLCHNNLSISVILMELIKNDSFLLFEFYENAY